MSATASVQSIDLRRDSQGKARIADLFVYTSLLCNKTCRHCFVSSSPTNRTLDEIDLADLEPVLEEARQFGVEQIYFTGGEPFLNRAIVSLLGAAMEVAPLTVYTNASEPLEKKLVALASLNDQHRSLHGRPILLRVSFDHYEAEVHDIYYGRGVGAFDRSVLVTQAAARAGFDIALTAQEDIHNRATAAQVRGAFEKLFARQGLSLKDVKVLPDIPAGAELSRRGTFSEDPVSPGEFALARIPDDGLMCRTGRTLLKIDGQLRVYPCTLLVPDSADRIPSLSGYDMGATLSESVERSQALDHPACRAYCVRGGMTCAN